MHYHVCMVQVTNIKADAYKFTDTASVLPQLQALSRDNSLPLLSANLVYLTASNTPDKMETKLRLYFDHQPKRAEIYWFVHVEVQDDRSPQLMSARLWHLKICLYQAETGLPHRAKIQFYLQRS